MRSELETTVFAGYGCLFFIEIGKYNNETECLKEELFTCILLFNIFQQKKNMIHLPKRIFVPT